MSEINEYFLRLWPFVAMTVLILAGLIGFKLRKKFKFEKKVESVEEGVRTTLYVNYNRFAGRKAEDIVIKDFVPSTLEPEETGDAETEETDNGTKLRWTIDSLKPGEEKELSYLLVPEFDHETKMSLPRAELEINDTMEAVTDIEKAEFNSGN